MIVVDVLLGLNFLVLGACALRGKTDRREGLIPLASASDPPRRPEQGAPREAVVLQFRPRASSGSTLRSMSSHPSVSYEAPNTP
jgi:hypothetical protein